MSTSTPNVFDTLTSDTGSADPIDARLAGDLAARLAGFTHGNALAALLDDFRAAGYARDVQTWLAPGISAAPAPLPREAVTRVSKADHVIDAQWIADLAKRYNTDAETVVTRMARVLPWAVKTLTPRGEMPSDRGFEIGLDVLQRRAAR